MPKFDVYYETENMMHHIVVDAENEDQAVNQVYLENPDLEIESITTSPVDDVATG